MFIFAGMKLQKFVSGIKKTVREGEKVKIALIIWKRRVGGKLAKISSKESNVSIVGIINSKHQRQSYKPYRNLLINSKCSDPKKEPRVNSS